MSKQLWAVELVRMHGDHMSVEDTITLLSMCTTPSGRPKYTAQEIRAIVSITLNKKGD